MGRPDSVVLYHVLFDWLLTWQDMWIWKGEEPPIKWVIAEVTHVFDRVSWENDEGQFRQNNRVLWVIISFSDIFVVDADFAKKRRTVV